jgi:hypothetical protein
LGGGAPVERLVRGCAWVDGDEARAGAIGVVGPEAGGEIGKAEDSGACGVGEGEGFAGVFETVAGVFAGDGGEVDGRVADGEGGSAGDDDGAPAGGEDGTEWEGEVDAGSEA